MRSALLLLLGICLLFSCDDQSPQVNEVDIKKAEVTEKDGSKAHPAFRTSNEIVLYELAERRADDNHWVEGRPLDPAIGAEIFAIAARGTEFDLKELGPVSIGVMGPHYSPPPYVIGMSRTDGAGASDYLTFSLGLTLFAVTGDDREFEVAEADKERLAELIRSIRDPAMAPVE